MRKIELLATGIVSIVLVLAVLSQYLLPSSLPKLTDKENIVINTLFENTKPQCIGRYVINVPESFNNQLKDSVYIDDFKITSQFLYPPAFQQRIALREKALRGRKTSAKNAPALKEVILLSDGKGVIFDRNQSDSDDAYRILEAHIYVNHIAFIITTEILDLSAEKYSDEKKSYINISGFKEFETNTKPSQLAAMYSLISRLNGRLDSDIPIEKGVCIPNGFILDDENTHQQKIAFVYENDNFILFLESDNRYLGSSDTLLNREKEINNAIRQQQLYTIKKGNLLLNNIPAQQWVIAGKKPVYSEAENSSIPQLPYYDFWFYANEATATPIIPKLYIALHNQNKYSSYSDAEMVEIWDRIIHSLRYLPNAF